MAEDEKRYERFGKAARTGNLPRIRRMLTTGENPVPVDCLSYVYEKHVRVTALIHACQEGQLAIVQELIRAGADVNWNQALYTPLHVACTYGRSPQMVEALLAAGADVNATVTDDTTPLMRVVLCPVFITMAQRLTIARLLLLAAVPKCDINIKAKRSGFTALDHACACECYRDDQWVPVNFFLWGARRIAV